MEFGTRILTNRSRIRERLLDVSGSYCLRDSLNVNALKVHGGEEVGSSTRRQVDDEDLITLLEEKGGPAWVPVRLGLPNLICR
jgi:c-di-GMP-binding flagellar brake protein YcgR